MEQEPLDQNSIEANRLIKEFEKRAKEAEENSKKGLIPSKTTRLIERFEKKSQGVDEKKGSNGNSVMINQIKRMFEPCDMDDSADDNPSNIISAGSTNKLIGRFQPESQQS